MKVNDEKVTFNIFNVMKYSNDGVEQYHAVLEMGRVFCVPIQPNHNCAKRSREYYFHMSLWHLCIPTHVIRFVQYARILLEVHDGNLLRPIREIC